MRLRCHLTELLPVIGDLRQPNVRLQPRLRHRAACIRPQIQHTIHRQLLLLHRVELRQHQIVPLHVRVQLLCRHVVAAIAGDLHAVQLHQQLRRFNLLA